MRKYRGTRPSHIANISMSGDIALIETNEGGKYFLDTRIHPEPKVGRDIYSLPFQRAQPMNFRQEVSRFYRIIDGEEWPFVEYPGKLNPSAGDTLEAFERRIRRQFLSDMSKQNIYVRFK